MHSEKYKYSKQLKGIKNKYGEIKSTLNRKRSPRPTSEHVTANVRITSKINPISQFFEVYPANLTKVISQSFTPYFD